MSCWLPITVKSFTDVSSQCWTSSTACVTFLSSNSEWSCCSLSPLPFPSSIYKTTYNIFKEYKAPQNALHHLREYPSLLAASRGCRIHLIKAKLCSWCCRPKTFLIRLHFWWKMRVRISYAFPFFLYGYLFIISRIPVQL